MFFPQLSRALQSELATESPAPGAVVLAEHGSHRIAEQQPSFVAAEVERVVARARK